jgi:hypothetical protein
MTSPGGYCDPNGDGSFTDADWTRGYTEYLAACGYGPAVFPPTPAGSCQCTGGVNNFCAYPPSTANCPMTAPGGYCDPNGDKSYTDGDWTRGYNEYQAACGGGGSSSSSSSSSSSGGGPCGSTCTQCVLGARPDIVPLYVQNGWDTSCGNLDNLAKDWSGIDPTACYGLHTGAGACTSACAGTTFCGSSCSQCIFGHRADLVPFYKQNGWAIQCNNLDNIITNWCGIAPGECGALKTGSCVSVCP